MITPTNKKAFRLSLKSTPKDSYPEAPNCCFALELGIEAKMKAQGTRLYFAAGKPLFFCSLSLSLSLRIYFIIYLHRFSTIKRVMGTGIGSSWCKSLHYEQHHLV